MGGRETEEPRTTWQFISSRCEGGTLLEDPLTSFSLSQHLRQGVLYAGKSSLLRTSERQAQSTFGFSEDDLLVENEGDARTRRTPLQTRIQSMLI